ncbi:dipeptide epimerase [Maribellus sp. CM-23]|uniref:dipeptide epimerase n=1 Tax=Maribellus sp. CM-23 TaxID=2781026 RepID=UPI001F3775E1|nr:dipeptide epimerase [Maribellus sp. CM-23]MCE4565834.1 dipeptide epimerase [Maribellus sp. CM-23]
MEQSRRTFIRSAGLLSVAGMAGVNTFASMSKKQAKTLKSGLKLRFKPYDLQLKHTFTLAGSSRTTTPVMLTEIEYDGVIGYGEASMPPYLGESHATATSFLSSLDLGQFNNPFRLDEILEYVDQKAEGNCAAKASVDIALHDLLGKIMGQPWYKIWGFNAEDTPNTSFTIGIDTDEVVRQKVKEAAEFKILKVKLGRDNDKQMIETIRAVTDVPMCVDVNQGWTDKKHALEMTHWLQEKGIEFVEQPMPKTAIDDIAWLTQHSPLPIIADEALQRLPDVKKAHGIYSGINIKLMKCTGMREAHKMITLARALDMKVMIGCMTETSCAVSAAAQLAPKVDWADLDGNLLISNDVFSGVLVKEGKITLIDAPGIGIQPLG